jgi:uncharacterized spore protein YtfJ
MSKTGGTYGLSFKIPKAEDMPALKFIKRIAECIEGLEEVNNTVTDSIDDSVKTLICIKGMKVENGYLVIEVEDKIL